MKRILLSAAMGAALTSVVGLACAQSSGPTIHNKVTTNQQSTPPIVVPTVVVTVTQALQGSDGQLHTIGC